MVWEDGGREDPSYPIVPAQPHAQGVAFAHFYPLGRLRRFQVVDKDCLPGL